MVERGVVDPFHPTPCNRPQNDPIPATSRVVVKGQAGQYSPVQPARSACSPYCSLQRQPSPAHATPNGSKTRPMPSKGPIAAHGATAKGRPGEKRGAGAGTGAGSGTAQERARQQAAQEFAKSQAKQRVATFNAATRRHRTTASNISSLLPRARRGWNSSWATCRKASRKRAQPASDLPVAKCGGKARECSPEESKSHR